MFVIYVANPLGNNVDYQQQFLTYLKQIKNPIFIMGDPNIIINLQSLSADSHFSVK